MVQSFLELKRDSNNVLNKFRESVDKQKTKYEKDDKRFWKPTKDKAGNAYAVIRFLPPAPGDEFPYEKYFKHAFKNPKTNMWYIEWSRTSLGTHERDPVAEYNRDLWNKGMKDEARKQKRKITYVSNIYVVNDPANPENNGKVFLFEYGQKIFDRITAMTNPEFEYDKPVNIWDLWGGCNFVLKMRQKDGFPNYDNSEWEKPQPLLDDDKALEKVWKSQHSLKEFIDPSNPNYKSYDDLKARFDRVMGFTAAPMSQRSKPTVEVHEGDVDELVKDMDGEDFIKNLESELDAELNDINWDTDD